MAASSLNDIRGQSAHFSIRNRGGIGGGRGARSGVGNVIHGGKRGNLFYMRRGEQYVLVIEGGMGANMFSV